MLDRYGLTVSTSSPVAFDHYVDGMDALLSYGPEAEEAFSAALAADDGLALAHSGRALLALVVGDADSEIGRAHV